MRKILLIAIFTLSFIYSFGWGKEGHAIVAEIADRYISASTRQKVNVIKGSTSIEEAANWMDEQRGNHQYDYMKPWHYLNMEKGEQFDYSRFINIPNLFQALQETHFALRAGKLDDEARKIDLMVIMHLVGDIHQPLHAGYGSDKGGNTVQVQFNGRGTNLHHVWDTDIIKDQHITLESCLALGKKLSGKKMEKLKEIRPHEWIAEDRVLLAQVYDFTGHKLDGAYAAKNKSVIERQLFYAGVRLAAMLDDIFDNPQLDKAEIAGPVTFPAEQPEDKQRSGGYYRPEEAIRHVGEDATICGKIYSIRSAGKSGPVFINIGGAYPDNPITAVIFQEAKARFRKDLKGLHEGKEVCISGMIKAYKGKPEIVLTERSQIRLQ